MIGILISLLAFPVAAESPDLMKRQPDVPLLADFAVPERVRFQLENGMRVVLVEDHRVPLVTVSLAFVGAGRIPGKGSAGVADAFAALLTAGTARLNARTIVEEADAFGGTLAGSATDDDIFLSGFSLSEKAERLFSLLDHCAFESTFPEAEVRLRRENMLEELSINRSQTDYLGGVAFWRALFGDHPYGTAVTEETIAKIDRKGLGFLHVRASVPSNMILYVVGDIDRKWLEVLLQQTLSKRTGRGALTVPPYPELKVDSKARRRVLLLDRPGSAQAALRIGHRAPRETHPDYPAFEVANMVLGGSFAARLTTDLREKRGYTYGIYSSLPSWRSSAAFDIGSKVRTEVAGKSIKVVLKHLKKMRRRGISDAEIRQAKNLLIAGFVSEFETQSGTLEAVSHADLRGLPENYLDLYVHRIQKVTRKHARAAARAHIHPDKAALVVVGDAATLERSLKRLSKPPLARVDENGVPLAR